ncbi:MAG: GNAT family N-acetyltransferase [Furfurilactobacillus sp.]|jgi:GNAT superfamily N-acetyltransferase|nr:GNAT family N-acetyltransferase [Furfurilactobacillus sp.]MCH4012106.1 GNAT family N-acetyltransferase [Furfurilactobacillus sp.]MCH4037998.1 GNAT family N-acetyltransferase [Furfurilactobacillus sp.]MCH4115365.1 GNAT family N-acetyltransferase [Furfurilactobacillus sp.]MCI1340586.1 GNAT family N-acetyltransferase [Furfurilactobacillus sp.]MCI1387662.1 GNAT family N-acetyltransferase [Furfurilactobacillus sp.]
MSNETNYQLTLTLPTPEEFCALRKAAGLSPRSLATATRGLPNSLMGVSIRKQGQLVAMARVVGDGSIVFEVVDVAVTPSEQGHGLGKQLMRAVTNYLSEHAPADADVSLIADVPADHLYAQFGFQPTAPESIGMAWHRE